MNPYVFVVGCPRSGTTLLERVVNAHPQIAIVHESRWIARIYEERRGLTADGLVTPKVAERLRQPRSLKPFGLDADEMGRIVVEHDGAPFHGLVTELFDIYAEKHEKPLAGDKSPGYVRYLPLLHELWPDARFVHIVRDGRDVFLSVAEWGKGAARFSAYRTDPAVTVARWWEWYVRLGREGGATLGPERYYELKYETLVAEPEQEAARLCEFMSVPFDARMLRFHEGRTRDDPHLDAKKAWRPITGGLRSWREQMDGADVARFQAVAGDLLVELGYPVPPHPLGDAASVALTVRAFDAEVRAGRRPIPVSWKEAVA